ncbi:MAG: hypothetical protein Q8908_11565 [Bacteroidota bacterium]|nr:hypothetical protein [Bacteroidota bacterium]
MLLPAGILTLHSLERLSSNDIKKQAYKTYFYLKYLIFSFFLHILFFAKNTIAMKEENTEKKEWVKPEIIDLDLDKTAGGAVSSHFEHTHGTMNS